MVEEPERLRGSLPAQRKYYLSAPEASVQPALEQDEKCTEKTGEGAVLKMGMKNEEDKRCTQRDARRAVLPERGTTEGKVGGALLRLFKLLFCVQCHKTSAEPSRWW